jgi:ABC-2 type transport system permease protein
MFGMHKIEKCSWWNGFRAVAGLCARQVFDGNLFQVLGEYVARFVQFLMLTLIWRSLAAGGVDLGSMNLDQLLTYTLMASVLRQQLEILTPATSALWEGSIISRYTRPMPVLQSLTAETIGRWWVPVFFMYSLPVWLLSPLMGIHPLPYSTVRGLLTLLSLALSASLGFALDYLFASLAMRMKNGCWAVTHVREALFELLSGALIPFSLMPVPVAKILQLLPMGSIAHAPLTLYVGQGDPLALIALQAGWNVVLWPLARYVFKKSEERMISYGG